MSLIPPVIIVERAESPQVQVGVETPTAEGHWWISGTDVLVTARQAVESVVPLVYPMGNGLSVQTLFFQSYRLDYKGNGLWDVTANYAKRQPRGSATDWPFPKTHVTSFEIGSRSQHMTQSIATVAKYALPGKTAPDCKGAIGVNGDSVEGVDTDDATFTWSETWYVPTANLTLSYLEAVFNVRRAPVNNAPFRGFDTGEVYFHGASGAERDGVDAELTFRFEASPNADNLYVGGVAGDPSAIGPITKGGWEYLWTRYQDNVDANQLVKKPVAVYVEQVKNSSDFTQLGIGT